MMKRRYMTIILAAILQSCVYPYTPDLPEDASDRIVIEGDISVGENCMFAARKMLPLTHVGNTVKTFVDKAVFTVEHDSGLKFSATQLADDIETHIDLTSAPVNGRYRLIATITDSSGNEDYATPWMELTPAPVIGDLEEKVFDSNKDRVADRVSLSISLSAENSSGCYSWDYDELYYFRSLLQAPEQEYVDGGLIIDHSEDITSWWPYTYCWAQTKSKVTGIAIAKALEGWNLYSHEFLELPLTAPQLDMRQYYIRFKAKSIPEDKYRFLDALNKGSDDSRNLLSPLPGEVFGNIRSVSDSSKYALGYVSANIVAKKILRVGSSGHRAVVPASNYYYYAYYSPDMTAQETNMKAYSLGYYPFKIIDRKQWWVPLSCVDCRASGGTLERPDGWIIDE